MQQITGRLTADAVVATTNGGKEVVNFRIADNETYRRKGETEPTTVTTFFSCAYWGNVAVAQVLRKGAVVQLNGRVSARPYESNTGDMAVSLDFNANRISVLAYAARDSKPAVAAKPAKEQKKPAVAAGADKDDLPF